MDIAFNTPICLKAHTGNNLQNEFFWRRYGRCSNQNTDAWEQMVLIKTEDEKIIIQSRWNGRNLQVQKSGQCVFANHNQELWEKFEMEVDKNGKVYFISCHTGNVMQCNKDGFAWCVNKNRQDWEAWTVILPKKTSMMTSGQLRTIALSVTSAVVCPVVGLVAVALVPIAMATFGIVVAGVGTFHASLAAGGCAAILQSSSAALITVEGVAAGAIAGAAIGSISDSKSKST